MSQSKRHHWWPKFHSNYWAAEDGLFFRITEGGNYIRLSPANASVIKRDNSFLNPDGSWNDSVETAFANEIDGPASQAIRVLMETAGYHPTRLPFINHGRLRANKGSLSSDGLRYPLPDRFIHFTTDARLKMARYVASMLVRVPAYKGIIDSEEFIRDLSRAFNMSQNTVAIQWQREHFKVIDQHLITYIQRLRERQWFLIEPDVEQEFLFSDAPVITAPIMSGDIDVFFPLSPKRALLITGQFSPSDQRIEDFIQVFRVSGKVVRSYNKHIVMNARQYVFSRGSLPLKFIERHFGALQAILQPRLNEPVAIGADHDVVEIGNAPFLS